MMKDEALRLGGVVLDALLSAIRRGLDRKAALEEAAAALEREDVVSDELLERLREYTRTTRDFEEDGA